MNERNTTIATVLTCVKAKLVTLVRSEAIKRRVCAGYAVAAANTDLYSQEVAAPALSKIPQPLVAMLENRKAIHCGRIEWARKVGEKPSEVLSFVSEYARNGDFIFQERGDAEGWTVRSPDGKGVHRFPQLYLSNKDGFWKTQETGLSVFLWPRGDHSQPWEQEAVKDIRSVGLGTNAGTLRSTPGSWDSITQIEGVRMLDWKETTIDGLAIVSCNYEDNVVQSWYLDPAKGFQPTRVTLEIGRRTVSESRSELHCVDGIWFPETTYYYQDGALTESIVVTKSELDAKRGRASLSPSDVGIEPGMDISRQGVGSGRSIKWDGDRIVDIDEWYRALKAGARQWGPKMKRLNDGNTYDSPFLTESQRRDAKLLERSSQLMRQTKAHDGLWVKFVRDFCEQFQFDQEQRQKATVVLSQCQSEATSYAKSTQNEFNEAIEEIEKAKNNSDTQGITRWSNRLDELRKPIDAIFENRLKPRLEKLPTREQRRKAAAQTSSQPAPTP